MKTLAKILGAVTFALTCSVAVAHNGGGGGHFGGGFGHGGFGGSHYYGAPWGIYGYDNYPWGWYGYGPYYDSGAYPNSSIYHSLHSLTVGVQTELASRGFYSGPIDGVLGPATYAGIRRYQAKHRLPVTGTIDQKLIHSLGLE
jgi:hypothetical protein